MLFTVKASAKVVVDQLFEPDREELRKALGVVPDPCAEARERLEQAVADDVIRRFESGCGPRLWHYVCINRGHGGEWKTPDYAVEAEALNDAADHADGLRKPAKPEPESMTLEQCWCEMLSLSWFIMQDYGLLEWFRHDPYCIVTAEPNETLIDFHRRALRAAREDQ